MCLLIIYFYFISFDRKSVQKSSESERSRFVFFENGGVFENSHTRFVYSLRDDFESLFFILNDGIVAFKFGYHRLMNEQRIAFRHFLRIKRRVAG